jgi:BirA family biotin operon repressor/biotin-[acetyl-CoA-carboxylase] ligase
LPAATWPLLSIVVGVAVAEALIEAGRVDARLKWPNDVLIGGRKVAGILLERHGDVVLIGIGINVAQRAVPAAFEAIATSVALAGGTPDREAILLAVLDDVGRWRARLEQGGFEPVRARWIELTAMLGQQVSVDGVGGCVVGLDADGALLLERAGALTRVTAGEVQPVPAQPAGQPVSGPPVPAIDTPEGRAYTARNLV